MSEGARWYDADQQLSLVEASLHDKTPVVPTGVGGIDSLLRRGGLLPGSLTLLGGRTGTRKTTTASNMVISMAESGIPVMFMGLDEPPWMYVIKLMSVKTGRSQDWLEEHWDEPIGARIRREWRDFAHDRVFVVGGKRPSIEHIQSQVDLVSLGDCEPPRVIFVDYLGRMSREGNYGYSENTRIPRLVEDLATWTTETNTAAVVLHQLSRNDEYGSTNNRNAGHLPMTLAQLKFAGEDDADMVLGTYRPAKNPIANMSEGMAKQALGDKWDEEEYYALRQFAAKTAHSTFLQLLKNRPGVHVEESGVELLSLNDSLRMEEKLATDTYDEETHDEPADHRA